jgi:hypothetical protein
MMYSPVTIASLLIGLAGVTLSWVGRRRLGLADWGRAFMITSVAMIASERAFVTHSLWVTWLSGFLVCAALHRWIDAVTRRKADAGDAAP